MSETGPLTSSALGSLVETGLPVGFRSALERAAADSCPLPGVVVRIGGRPVGLAACTSPDRPERSLGRGTAWLLAVWVDPGHTAGGLGRVLVRALAADLRRRGGVEALDARAPWLPRALQGGPWGEGALPAPRGFLTAVGFRPAYGVHPARLRLDLGATVPGHTTTAPPRVRGRRRAGPAVCTASRSGQLMNSSSSLSSAALGRAPTMVRTTSPPW